MRRPEVPQAMIQLLIAAPLAVLIGYLAARYPESVVDVAIPGFWAFVFLALLHRAGQRWQDQKWLTAVMLGGLVVRFAMIPAHLVVGFWIYQGQLDFPSYFASAVARGEQFLRGDFQAFDLFDYSSGMGGRNVAAQLLTFSYFFVGPSLSGMLLFSGAVAFLGSYLFLRAFQTAFPSYHGVRFLAIGLFFFPSLAFWSSVIGKDSFMFFFLALTTYSIARIVKTVRLWDVCGLIVGVTFVTLIRAPVGILVILAAGVCGFMVVRTRAPAMLRPLLWTAVGLVLIGGMTVGRVSLRPYMGFIEAPEEMSQADSLLALAVHRQAGMSRDVSAGGSSFAAEVREGSPAEVARFLPAAVFRFLFRPLVFEAHNVVALIAGVDATLLLLVVLWRWKHLLAAIRGALSSPWLAFCLTVFVLTTIGLAFEANFGVMVRHRAMVLPFLFILIAVPRRGGIGARYAAAGGQHGEKVGAARDPGTDGS